MIRQIKQKTIPSRMRNVRFGRGDSAVRRNGLGLKVACPAQSGWNLKGRCLLLWPFYSVIRWRRRTAACAPDALRASAATRRQTVRSQQVPPSASVRPCAWVRCCACAKLCVRPCAYGERERETGGRGGGHTEERISNGIPDHSLPPLTKDSSLRIPLASTRLLSRIMSSRLRKTSVCTPLPSRCTLRKYCCSAE